jgi:hypothetical protein
MPRGKAQTNPTCRPADADGGILPVVQGLAPSRRRVLHMVVAALAASALPFVAVPGQGAAYAKGKDDSSGSGSSGSGSSGSDDDDEDDEDEDEDEDHSGHGGGGSGSGSGSGGSGSGGSGSSGSGSGNSGPGGGNRGGPEGASRGNQELLWVKFRDGHTEQIRSGTFLRTNGSGALVEQRRALRSDVTRLTSYRSVSASSIREIESLILLSASQNAAQVIDRSGWAELISGGVYQLTDPNGNLVTRRAATGDDMQRISVMAGQN